MRTWVAALPVQDVWRRKFVRLEVDKGRSVAAAVYADRVNGVIE